ncbi:energy transducer TonB [Winogradskyella sp.]|uniref:energy transducer TonB n=1 Tax=Winogradskyella sp. TaxID=1883156 RepID=UPI003BA8C65D
MCNSSINGIEFEATGVMYESLNLKSMVLKRSKAHPKLRSLLFLVCPVSLVCSFSFAQESDVKTKSKEPAIEGVEIVENIEISSDQELEYIPFAVVDHVPYPSECKGMETKDDKRKCAVEFIQQHTLKKFDTSLGTTLGLSPGKKRIFARFKFDKSGKVIDVEARGPHPEIEKEAVRIIKLLPDFIPGEHQGEKVDVSYSLPMTFFIYENERKN